jgi:hypothetical protein
MARWKFWKKEPNQPQRTTVEERPPVVAPRARGFVPPPRRDDLAGETDPSRSKLIVRYNDLVAQLEEAERASDPDNPWTQRVTIIDQALVANGQEERALDKFERRAEVPLPPTKISNITVKLEDPPSVSFRIGSEPFFFEEEIDWAERGTNVVRGELVKGLGSTTRLLPKDLPLDRASDLLEHLEASLFVFASDLRDRSLAGEPLPASPTLASLARPCPTCGGWQDWRGNCPECQQREMARRRLHAEREHLQSERARQADERAKRIDQAPVIRRRLADVEASLRAQDGDSR